MKAYRFDKKTRTIDCIIENVTKCEDNSIYGSVSSNGVNSIIGMNLNIVDYIVSDKEFNIGDIIPKDEEDKRNEFLNQSEKIKLLETQLAEVMKLLNKK